MLDVTESAHTLKLSCAVLQIMNTRSNCCAQCCRWWTFVETVVLDVTDSAHTGVEIATRNVADSEHTLNCFIQCLQIVNTLWRILRCATMLQIVNRRWMSKDRTQCLYYHENLTQPTGNLLFLSKVLSLYLCLLRLLPRTGKTLIIDSQLYKATAESRVLKTADRAAFNLVS